jgi:hypothetical protein
MPSPELPQTLLKAARRTIRQPFQQLAKLSLLLAACLPLPAIAISCTTPGAMQTADRDAILTAANPLAAAVAAQNLDLLQTSLLPSVAGDWEGIRSAIQTAGPLTAGGQVRWRSSYLLDATDLKTPADSQFFCTNFDSSMTVTINLRNLPPGRYALLIGDFASTPQAGQLALILGFDGKWKLGGFFAREGSLDGHDGIWFWTHARESAKANLPWSAWYSYDTARSLLSPVDFLSSPNLEKLNAEQQKLTPPADSMPLTVPGAGADAGKNWKVTAAHLDTTLRSADLAIVYEGTGITDPIAARAEAIAVMSGLLRIHPGLRQTFHGLWAYAEKDGKRTYAIELAMKDIP